MLHGRNGPIAAIDALLDCARDRRSGALLLHGEAGIGKSALLEYAESKATGLRVLRGVAHQSEAELPFGLLDQLTRPLLPLVPRLPKPQSDALSGALGLSEEPVKDRFLVSAALLSLLAEAAEPRPVLCLVDDIQWADQGSVNALTFTARRLQAEGVVILMAARTESPGDMALRGIPDCPLEGLDPLDSLALIRDQLDHVSASAENKLIESCAGNPLALLELPRVLNTELFEDAASLPDPLPVGVGIRRAFLEQIRVLSAEAQALLVIAAADPEATVHDVLDVTRDLGLSAQAATDAEASGLVALSHDRFVFRHPLIRAVAYHDASVLLRQRIHLCLANRLSGAGQHGRQSWHRSLTVSGPDEAVAATLVESAMRSQARGALETASRAFERAAELSPAPQRSATRLAEAAQMAASAGQPGRARALIERAAALNVDDGVGIQLDDLRGRLELRTGVPTDAHAFLTSAASRVVAHDPTAAIRMLTEAGEAASYAGDRSLLATTGQQAAALIERVSRAAALPALVLHGAANVVSGQAERGRSLCRDAVALAADITDPRDLVWASIAAQYAGDVLTQHALAVRATAAARATGEVAVLPYALEFQALSELWSSRFSAARATATEGLTLARELHQQNSIGRHLATLAWLDAAQGAEAACRSQCAEVLQLSAARGLGLQGAAANWALGLLELTLGRPEEAYHRLARLLTTAVGESHPNITLLAAADIVEAAQRSGRAADVGPLVGRFADFAGSGGPAWAGALLARCRALLGDEEDQVRRSFEEALRLHEASNRPWDEARTTLLYGEYLRRTRRRIDARTQLRRSVAVFEALGAGPWTERAQGELRATGETTSKRDVGAVGGLSPQEYQIVTLVTSGSSNRDVAAQLFLSPRTVEYHLSKVYAKLGLSSRAELRTLETNALAASPSYV